MVVSPTVHPNYRAVMTTYLAGQHIEMAEPSLLHDRTVCDLDAVRPLLTEDTAALIVQYPNFLGSIEDLTVGVLLPGVSINSSGTEDPYPIEAMQIGKYDQAAGFFQLQGELADFEGETGAFAPER